MPSPLQTLRAAIKDFRAQEQPLIDSQPDEAVTPGQRMLGLKHGTPRGFAEACTAAVVGGDITVDQSHDAIASYRRIWEAAS